MSEMWNLWHGCHKKSEGCLHCYVFRRDAEFEKDSNVVSKTSTFNLPIRRIEEADAWREDAWLMIQRRSDLHFFMITKRPERIAQCLPNDWGNGYENVTICCTMENQRRVDERLPLYRELPIRHKSIICEPLLGAIDFHDGLGSWCEQVTVGGESGRDARVCDYDWVLNIREQCIKSNVPFHFKQTGAHFRKDGRLYNIPRNQQIAQAHRAGIDIKQ